MGVFVGACLRWCQGARLPRTPGVTEIDLDAGCDGECCIRCHLRAAILGQALLQRNRQLVHLSGKR